jgi:predicted dehydrogenase
MVVELLRPRSQPAVAFRRSLGSGIRVAVVGCGYWGSKHVRVLSSLADVSQIVVVDPDQRACRAIAGAFPNVAVAADLEEALDRADAVIVASPPREHFPIALAALRAGCHVLVEKPLTTNIADARALVSEADQRALTLMVGHTFEFNPAVHELRRRVDAGELGAVRYVHSARLSLGLFREDVNVIWDLAPHDISIMNYVLRSTPSSVTAWGSSHVARGIVDLAYFQLEYSDRNVTGYGHVSWLDPRKVRQVTVVGSRKMALYDDLADERLRIFDRGVEPPVDRDSGPSTTHGVPLSYRYGDIVSPHINFQEPLMLEDRNFIDCALGRAEVVDSGASGVAVIAVLDAIDRSIASGGRITVECPSPEPSRSPTVVLA